MRDFINIVRESVDRPFIDAHMSGPNTVEIEMMVVPQQLRGTGAGRLFYQQWEEELPSEVKLVQLWCADADGSGKANGFWEAMGFDYKFSGEPANPDADIWWWMWKGVNGHPTPQTIVLDDEELTESIICEEFQHSDYGYWITPEGEIQPCTNWDHATAAAAQLGIDPEFFDGEERDLVDQGLEEGSARVVAIKGRDEFAAEWGMAVTTEARRSLVSLLKFYSDRDAFVLQSEYFSDYRKAQAYVRTA
jgi:hypothetical protein